MKTTCEFRFGFWDVTARGDAHFAVSQNQDYARIEDINAEDPICLLYTSRQMQEYVARRFREAGDTH